MIIESKTINQLKYLISGILFTIFFAFHPTDKDSFIQKKITSLNRIICQNIENYLKEESIKLLFPPLPTSELIPAGSYIINMGVYPQNSNTALKPYGLIWHLLHNHEIPIIWSIQPGKDKDGVDFYYNGQAMRGGPFIIHADYMTPAVIATINQWENEGVVGVTTYNSVTVPVNRVINYSMNWTLDHENGQIAQKYLEEAEIPSSAYNWTKPEDLNCCNDVFLMPHAHPDWDSHNNLLFWNDAPINGGCAGAIWAGCKAVSELENIYNPNNSNQKLNFLMLNSSQPAVDSKDHDDGDFPPPYLYDHHDHPIMQFIGKLDGAQENGAEQVYLPTVGWRPTTLIGVWDHDHPDVPNYSPGKAAKLAFGPAFGNSTRGYIGYEAGHKLNKNANPENIAAQRAFFNFSFMAVGQKAIHVTSNIPENMNANNTYNLSATATGGTGNYIVQWSSSCPGTFSNPNATNTTFSLNNISQDTDCFVKVTVMDDCGTRVGFANVHVEVTSGPEPPTAQNDFGLTAPCTSATIYALGNDNDPDNEPLILTFTSPSNTGNGIFVNNGNGTVTYTPNAGFSGTDVITYQVCDPNGLCDNATISFQITDNLPPIAVNDNATTFENTPIIIPVLSNDNDPENGNMDIIIYSQPSNGSVSVDGNSIVYVPATNYLGADSFQYQICDDGCLPLCDLATVDVFISCTATPNENHIIGAVFQDQSNNGILDEGENGVGGVKIDLFEDSNENGTVDGGDVFVTSQYTDNNGGYDFSVTLSINNNLTLSPSIDALIASNLPTINYESQPFIFSRFGTATQLGLFQFDFSSIPSGAIITNATFNLNLYSGFDVSNTDALYRVTSGWGSGVTYNTTNGFTSWVSGSFSSNDYAPTPQSTPHARTVGLKSLDITSLVKDWIENGVPNYGFALMPTSSSTTSIVGYSSDEDADLADRPTLVLTGTNIGGITNTKYVLQIDLTTLPLGNPTLTTNNEIPVEFTNSGQTDCANNFGFILGNNPPIAEDDEEITQVNVSIAIDALINDTDPDGDAITLTSISSFPSEGGTVSINYNDTISDPTDDFIDYTPLFNYVGVETFEYVICDNGTPSLCDTALVTITIEEDLTIPPVANDDDESTVVNTPIVVDVQSNDIDPSGFGLTTQLVLTNLPTNGQIEVINGDSIIYSPNLNFIGNDVFQYEICNVYDCDIAFVYIDVLCADPVDGANLIQGLVFIDSNLDTLLNDIELGATNVEVLLYEDLNQNGEVDGSDSFIESTFTDENGHYSFEVAGISSTMINQDLIDPFSTDTDGDGTPNLLDLDDDNDGLRDLDECPNIFADFEGISGSNRLNVGDNPYTTNLAVDGTNLTTSVTISAPTPVNGVENIYILSEEVSGDYQIVKFVDDLDAIPGQGLNTSMNFGAPNGVRIVASNLFGASNITQADRFTFTALNSPIGFEWEILSSAHAVITFSGSSFTIEGGPTAGVSGNTPFVDFEIVTNHPILGLNIQYINLTPESYNSGRFSFAFCPDTDGDGILDYIDLDSDADGCADAMEAGHGQNVQQGGQILGPFGNNGLAASVEMNDLESTSINYNIAQNSTLKDFINPNYNEACIDFDHYVVETNGNTYPFTTQLSTDNVEIANFNTAGQVDCNNDFGLYPHLPPIAEPDTAYTETGVSVEMNIIQNDRDPENTPLIVTLLTTPNDGVVVNNEDGSVTYTSTTSGFTGQDVFTYEICDSGMPSLCDTTWVVVIIDPYFNDPPVAINDYDTTVVNVDIVTDVIDNDYDPENDQLTVYLSNDLLQPTNGVITLFPNQKIEYLPNPVFTGDDTYEYYICDNDSPPQCDTAIVFIHVLNRPPFAFDDYMETSLNTAVSIPILQNDFELDGHTISITGIGTDAANLQTTQGGIISINTAGTINNTEDDYIDYTPPNGYLGQDTFFYQIMDSGTPHLFDQAMVIISIGAPIDLELSKEASLVTTLVVGNQLIYTLTLRNNGPSVATEVVIKDYLPEGVNYLSDNGNGNYDTSTNVWYIASLNPNSVTSLQLTTSIVDIQNLFNVTEVIAVDQIDIDSTPNNDDGDQSEDDEANAVICQNLNHLVSNDSPSCTETPIQLSVSDGGISYNWTGPNGFESTEQNPILEDISHLQDGIYAVTITTGNGCEEVLITEVSLYPTLQINPIGINPTCIEFSNGSIYLNPINNAAPFSYSWTNSTSSDSSTGTIIKNLSIGTYQITVEDTNGCESFGTINLTAPLECPEEEECTFYTTQIEHNCCKICDDGNLSVKTAHWAAENINLLNANVALNKPSIFNGNPNHGYSNAAQANDGKLTGQGNSNYDYAFSVAGSFPRWDIDLVGNYNLNSLTIFTKSGCCLGSAIEYLIFTSDIPFSSNNHLDLIGQNGVDNFSIPINNLGNPESINLDVTGRFVRIYLNGTGQLQLIEVEIIGDGHINSSPYSYSWSTPDIGNSQVADCLPTGNYCVTVQDNILECSAISCYEVE